MDPYCRLHGGLYSVACFALFMVAQRQPLVPLLCHNVPGFRPDDNQDHSGTFNAATIPILDRATHSSRSRSCHLKSSRLWTHASFRPKNRTVLSMGISYICIRCVCPLGTSCNHEYLRISRHQLFDDSKRKVAECKWWTCFNWQTSLAQERLTTILWRQMYE